MENNTEEPGFLTHLSGALCQAFDLACAADSPEHSGAKLVTEAPVIKEHPFVDSMKIISDALKP